MLIRDKVQPLYVGSDEPDLVGYYPKWLDNLADDVTLEGSMLDGVVVGKEGVRAIVVAIRAFYDRQEHKFADVYRENRFIEEYIAVVGGEPSAVSCSSPTMPMGKPSTSWRVTGHVAR